ncbi:hypothetical protein [Dokdonella sp.]|uniref:hypothetical protein n=1 Tax=Dokdonella sp. TaxID=2291710 RepID=UPI0035274EB6
MIRVPTTRAAFARIAFCIVIAWAATFQGPLLAGSNSAPHSSSTDLSVSLVSVSEYAPHWPPDLEIRLVWPVSCLPVISRTTLEGFNIDVHLRGNTAHCATVSTPVSLKVNPARESGRDRLALGIYQVRLYLEQAGGNAELIGFRLLQSGGDITLSRPESGFWWSVPGSEFGQTLGGSGVSIEQQGDDIAVSLLSYEAGSPVWYFGSATMPGNTTHVQLVRMVGGDEPFSAPFSSPGAEPGMSLHLEFLSPSQAHAWLVRPRSEDSLVVDIQPLNLMRVPFNEGPAGQHFRGEWVLVTDQARDAKVVTLVELITSDQESFRLVDKFGSVSLQCRSRDIGGYPSAVFCSLTEGSTVLADFDQIGLDRLSGLDASGTAVRLIRLPR